MKKYLLFSAAVAALTFVSCTKDNPVQQTDTEEVELTVKINMPDAVQTKAVSAYTTAQTYESQVNKMQVFVFDGDGALNGYTSSTNTSANLSVTSGQKKIYAIVNGPDLASVKTISELKEHAVDLADNSKTSSTGFIMAGDSECEVSGSSATCSITVSRLVSRVALVSVKNSLPSSYGALRIERIWVSNIVGNQNLNGDAAPSTWYNKEGRADETNRVASHIIDGTTYKASAAELTYKTVGESVANGGIYTPSTPDLFYAYPNSSTVAPDGFHDPFAAQRTVLVVAATVGGKLYYYPIVLDDAELVRNTTYTVALTITGLGSDDPNKPVTKGGLTVNVTVAGWESGAVYDEVI